MLTFIKVVSYFEAKANRPFLSALAAVAPILGAGISAFGAKKSNEAQVALSREQMAFQERMSNTAYQRATADMREANLNPMLAYMKGGASSPPGAQPQIKNVLEPFANSALNIARQYQEVENLRQQNILNLPSEQRAQVMAAAQESLITSGKQLYENSKNAKVGKIKYEKWDPGTPLDTKIILDTVVDKAMRYLNEGVNNIKERRGIK